ncbi:DUF1993 family protein [Neomegalonema sp.]|uniref:DUF1993 domain-containing protein n=1 Tax=Neomegalonema sp. TaxID=2039713 RepID=UPI0026091438|nr:DUF1993 domain-containing protein [Neomegalonema sp.]MDD2869073.1 DUF1993 domain-containing protein [Neomegalonema sp.]
MPQTLHEIARTVFPQSLEGLSDVLTKAEVWSMEKHIDASVLLNYRLTPDMFPLSKQVQTATDHARNALTRLSGGQAPIFADDAPSFDTLRHRIARTVAFVQEFPAEKLADAESRVIRIGAAGREREMDATTYLLRFALPNFYFHISMAYGILRHTGAPIGKRDFLGPFT